MEQEGDGCCRSCFYISSGFSLANDSRGNIHIGGLNNLLETATAVAYESF